jgi:hypothetical protein
MLRHTCRNLSSSAEERVKKGWPRPFLISGGLLEKIRRHLGHYRLTEENNDAETNGRKLCQGSLSVNTSYFYCSSRNSEVVCVLKKWIWVIYHRSNHDVVIYRKWQSIIGSSQGFEGLLLRHILRIVVQIKLGQERVCYSVMTYQILHF